MKTAILLDKGSTVNTDNLMVWKDLREPLQRHTVGEDRPPRILGECGVLGCFETAKGVLPLPWVDGHRPVSDVNQGAALALFTVSVQRAQPREKRLENLATVSILEGDSESAIEAYELQGFLKQFQHVISDPVENHGVTGVTG